MSVPLLGISVEPLHFQRVLEDVAKAQRSSSIVWTAASAVNANHGCYAIARLTVTKSMPRNLHIAPRPSFGPFQNGGRKWSGYETKWDIDTKNSDYTGTSQLWKHIIYSIRHTPIGHVRTHAYPHVHIHVLYTNGAAVWWMQEVLWWAPSSPSTHIPHSCHGIGEGRVYHIQWKHSKIVTAYLRQPPL